MPLSPCAKQSLVKNLTLPVSYLSGKLWEGSGNRPNRVSKLKRKGQVGALTQVRTI